MYKKGRSGSIIVLDTYSRMWGKRWGKRWGK